MQNFNSFFKESTTRVVAHGFSDRGVSSYRYTVIDPSVKLNQSAEHGVFNDDYNTDVYNTLEEAYKAIIDDLEPDQLDLGTFKKDFLGELLRNDTVVVYSFHEGNHFEEPVRTMLLHEEGNWNEVPLKVDADTIIKEYFSTKKADFRSRKDIPYEEVAPARETADGFYNNKKYKKIISIPNSKGLQAAINHYLETMVTRQIVKAKRGEYSLSQMEQLKDDEVFINLLKQGKLAGYDVSKFINYLRYFPTWFPQYKEDILNLTNHIKREFKTEFNLG